MPTKIQTDDTYSTLINHFSITSKSTATYIQSKFTIDLSATGIEISNIQDLLKKSYWNQELLRKFWHEYVHYMQFVSMPAGVTDFLKRSELIRAFGKSWSQISSYPANDRCLYDGTEFFDEARTEYFKYIDYLYGSDLRPVFVTNRSTGDDTYGAPFIIFKNNWVKLTTQIFCENMAQAITHNFKGDVKLPNLQSDRVYQIFCVNGHS
jgi:hypothetical protein